MKHKTWITQTPKKPARVIMIGVDIAKLPSQTHKWGAIKNKAQVFDDRRRRKPKYRPNYLED